MPAVGGQTIIAAAFLSGCCVFTEVQFFDEAFFKQRLYGAVERPGAEAQTAAGLLLDLPHDSVTVQIFIRQGEQNLEGGSGQWI